MPYAAGKMFELVADIERYPEFIPWCRAARIRSRSPAGNGEVLIADLVVAIKGFRETLVSKVTLKRDEGRIVVRYVDGPLKLMHSEWRFLDRGHNRSRVEYVSEFEFRSRFLTAFAGVFLDYAVSEVVAAFETRARTEFSSGTQPSVSGRSR